MKKGTSKPSIPELADTFIDGTLKKDDRFFTYGTALVEPVADTDSGRGRLKTITIPDLKWHVRRAYPDKSEGDIRAIAEDILHTPELPLQHIRGLVTTPTFRDDFSLIAAPGFDSTSGLYYLPDPSLRSFRFEMSASKDKANAALELLFELLKDFPFRQESERYAYIATLLTLFLRSAIHSVVPCLAIDGNGQSVGKGLLSSILSLIAYGRDASTISAPKGREEWASKLDSILLQGTSFQVVDNIVGAFASDDFASILTTNIRNVRIKGLSKVVDVPINTVWVLNGNHLSVDSDLAQRLIMCHLEHEDASGRQQEKFHIQKKYGVSIEVLLHEERAKYIQACLDIICGWRNVGAPRRKKLVLAKYSEWESIIGGIIDWIAPKADFLTDHHNQTLAVDQEREETILFLKKVMIAFPHCSKTPVSASDITKLVFPDFGKSVLRDFVPSGLIGGSGTSSFAIRIGRWLKNASTRRWGTVELIAIEDKHEGVWKYCIGANIKPQVVKAEPSLEDIFETPEAAAA